MDKTKAGCGLVVWSALTTTPLWLAFCLGVLQQINPPAWLWIVFWCYMMSQILGLVAMGLYKAAFGDEE